jgi:hypothetical protein
MGHVGLEPTTYGLKVRYSTIELMTLLYDQYTIRYRLVNTTNLRFSLTTTTITKSVGLARTESEGFEPPEDFNPRRFSKPLP